MSEPRAKRFPHHSEDSLYKIMGPGIPGDRISSYLGGPDLLTMKLISRDTNDMMKTHKPVDSDGNTRLQWALLNLNNFLPPGVHTATLLNPTKRILRYTDIIYEESQKYRVFDEITADGQSVFTTFSSSFNRWVNTIVNLDYNNHHNVFYILSQLSKAFVKIISVKHISFYDIAEFLLVRDEHESIYTVQLMVDWYFPQVIQIADYYGHILTAMINNYEGDKKKLCTKKFTGIGKWTMDEDTETTLIGNYKRRIKRAYLIGEDPHPVNTEDTTEFEHVLKDEFPIYWKMYSILKHTCKDYD